VDAEAPEIANLSHGGAEADAAPGPPDRASAIALTRPSPDGTPVLLALRAYASLLAAFEASFLLEVTLLAATPGGDAAPASHAINFAIAATLFAVSFKPAGRRHWRAAALAVAVAMISCAAMAAGAAQEPTALFLTVLVVVATAGALLPWEPPWQAAAGLSGVAVCALSEAALSIHAGGALLWLAVLAGAAGGQMASWLAAIRRRAHYRQLRQLRADRARSAAKMRASERALAELREAQRQLRANSDTMRGIFDALPEAIVVSREADGAILDYNSRFRALARNPGGLARLHGADAWLWRSAQMRAEFRRRLAAEGFVHNMEAEFGAPGNAGGPALVSAVRAELGGKQCVITTARSMRPYADAASRLRETEKALRKVFDACADAIAIIRVRDGKYLDVNPALLALSGLARDQVAGHTARELDFWIDRRRMLEFLATLARDGRVRNFEADICRRDGAVMSCAVSGAVIEFGGELCVVTFTHDISALKQTERELVAAREALSHQLAELRANARRLHQSEGTLRRVFDANLDAISINELASGAYVEVNREFLCRTGYAREEIVGRSFEALPLWKDPRQRQAFAAEIARKGELRNMEAEFVMKDGEVLPCLISGVVVELNGRRCCLAITRDVSALKATERKLVAAREAALAASHAKSEFLSSMSHEIRTPMNSILGMADLLAETSMTAGQRRYLETIISNGNLLFELINSILDLAKVESGRLSLERVAFNLRDLVERAAESLALRAHDKDLELLVRIEPGTPAVLIGDPLRLRQVLINLIGNAIKFTERGEVAVEVARDAQASESGRLRFLVRDTGVGIPPDKIESVFAPFTQADSSTTRKYGGSGLGLAIVKRLVDLMNGKVGVESRVDAGTTVRFTAEFGLQNSAVAEARPRQLSGPAILIVEPNANARAILREQLELAGADVSEAASGADAIRAGELANRASRPFQIVVMAERMAPLDGIETARHLDAGRGPAIVMTLQCDNLTEKIAKLRAIGIDHYVIKPVKNDELMAALEAALAGPAAPLRSASTQRSAAQSSPIIDRPLAILLADDSADNRTLVRAYLSKTPYRVFEVENGREAIERFTSGEFDLVLMDIQMPQVDGYTATREIRRWERANRRRPVPIIALTASALDEAVRQALQSGCDAHVSKPVKKATLLEAIRDAVEARAAADTAYTAATS
jgi:PAS domain S-box-containing protein